MLPVGSRTKRLRLLLSRFFMSSGEGEKIEMMRAGLSSFLSVLKGNRGTKRLGQRGKAMEGQGDYGSFVSGYCSLPFSKMFSP